MNKLIRITNIELNRIGPDASEITYTFFAGSAEYELRYMITGFEELTRETYEFRIDPLVVTFLIHAMRNGYDFSSEYPISKKLYYQILWHIAPQIHLCNKEETSLIRIDAPLAESPAAGHYVGTGFSGGVDSFTTVYEYTDLMPIEEYKITHLFYNQVGAHDGQIGKYDEEVETKLFQDQLRKTRKTAELLHLPLIVVESNLDEVLSAVFGFSDYDLTHTVRNLGAIYHFQQYFSKYYYADAYCLDEFDLDVRGPIAAYEKWLIPLLSSEQISFFSANRAMTRIEKFKMLSAYPLTYDNLLVCLTEGENCGKCIKCIRALVTLDMLGCLDLYKNSFNLEEYRKNREQYIDQIARLKESIYELMKEVNYPLPEYEDPITDPKEREIKKVRDELDSVYSSASWRVGNLLIQPLHLIKSLIRKAGGRS